MNGACSVERRVSFREVETELIGLRKKVRIRKNTGKSKSGKGRAIRDITLAELLAFKGDIGVTV